MFWSVSLCIWYGNDSLFLPALSKCLKGICDLYSRIPALQGTHVIGMGKDTSTKRWMRHRHLTLIRYEDCVPPQTLVEGMAPRPTTWTKDIWNPIRLALHNQICSCICKWVKKAPLMIYHKFIKFNTALSIRLQIRIQIPCNGLRYNTRRSTRKTKSQDKFCTIDNLTHYQVPRCSSFSYLFIMNIEVKLH